MLELLFCSAVKHLLQRDAMLAQLFGADKDLVLLDTTTKRIDISQHPAPAASAGSITQSSRARTSSSFCPGRIDHIAEDLPGAGRERRELPLVHYPGRLRVCIRSSTCDRAKLSSVPSSKCESHDRQTKHAD